MNYPAAIGPYNAYRVVGDLVFCSGQIPIDPATNEIPASLEAQAHQALKNVGGLLNEVGLSYKNVVKTTVFLSDINDFSAVNEIYATYFEKPYPARSAVAVKDLPKGVKLEVEVIAHKS
ncbi:endoribonuclease L-PSP [Campylobacter hyointestinalis subsp. hyointestinalis]|uniref:Endoribonuclease L-PSP n=1 Tax=Campylobacter hyointestinalis subsp. hyointestinalis TaxID=91352 RepID=A0A0S4RC87_CAMHY|nr:Rid family detoxifying hydrolase [Campylobacter hyointestinalis]PPB53444.1 reactive intermediate/imine deaminase [Campylobacter hyointestinalis subsp. hyointestinalis]PPB54539.1 reactive intermediate/imine deaminase [Campylobacter hyointestinalis subsp. hyointestinalis]PPB61037.1 reactive intermediate/imine deaminase [Campylobacter hyointestinalis subsp. hyointestinalis]PPB66331.1 reactive intermediate/imine deaminase [Campylobacter hyointestinalis subsp. hyointestinalis]CUU70821.1 endoribo